MTLFEWAWARWATPAPVAGSRTTVVTTEGASPHVGARYVALYTYLQHRYASNVVLTFEQMESLLGFALPTPAWTERDWCTSPAVGTDHHSDAWTVAQRTATPNLSARTVAFERWPWNRAHSR